jgi:hypothetical protein
MRRIKLAAAILAAVTGLLAAPGAANATTTKPDGGVYTTSYITRTFSTAYQPCSGGYLCNQTGWVHLQVYTTYTASQIWINGVPHCTSGGAVQSNITWCGVGGGNGTADLNVGLNWDVPAWDAYGLYERMDLYPDYQTCVTDGTNWKVEEIAIWALPVCDVET